MTVFEPIGHFPEPNRFPIRFHIQNQIQTQKLFLTLHPRRNRPILPTRLPILHWSLPSQRQMPMPVLPLRQECRLGSVHGELEIPEEPEPEEPEEPARLERPEELVELESVDGPVQIPEPAGFPAGNAD